MDKGDAIGMFVNPYYAVVLHDDLFSYDPEAGSDDLYDDWLDQNIDLMESIGPRAYFIELLDVLADPHASHPHGQIINPKRVVKFDGSLKGDHPLMVTRKVWIDANMQLLTELNSLGWLENFLLHMENPGNRYY